MQITRCGDQKSATLDEFYANLSGMDSHPCREGGKAMLNLISRLRALPDERRVWGLTSLHRLCLLSQDTYQSPWHVIIAVLDQRSYFIEYRMPEHLAPWPAAYVKGEARSEDEAVQMILTAMDRSEGWNENADKGAAF